jgi:hypothetical protein
VFYALGGVRVTIGDPVLAIGRRREPHLLGLLLIVGRGV